MNGVEVRQVCKGNPTSSTNRSTKHLFIGQEGGGKELVERRKGGTEPSATEQGKKR